MTKQDEIREQLIAELKKFVAAQKLITTPSGEYLRYDDGYPVALAVLDAHRGIRWLEEQRHAAAVLGCDT